MMPETIFMDHHLNSKVSKKSVKFICTKYPFDTESDLGRLVLRSRKMGHFVVSVHTYISLCDLYIA